MLRYQHFIHDLLTLLNGGVDRKRRILEDLHRCRTLSGRTALFRWEGNTEKYLKNYIAWLFISLPAWETWYLYIC